MSDGLQKFLQSHISHKLTHLTENRFSSDASTFLTSILTKIDTADHDYHDANMTYDTMFENELPRGSHYLLCPEKARKHIECMTSTGQSCRFSINGKHINIHLVYEHDPGRRPPFTKLFKMFFHRIYLLVHLLSSYSKKDCSRTLTIYLYLSSLKKTLDDCANGDCTIREDNANTAFTFACIKVNELYLYRKEEWFKVLGHELIHSFGLEFSKHNSDDVDRKVFDLIPIQTDVRLYEAYTELWGEMINIIFISYLSKREPSKPLDYAKIIRKIEGLLYQERMFSVFQASKILTHFGMSYEDLYERTDAANKIRRNYKESTPVLSYYIIKNVLMFYIGDFMEWCHQHNHGRINFDEKNIDAFLLFIRKHYTGSPLVESMDQMRTWFLERGSKANKEYIHTLRMTLLE